MSHCADYRFHQYELKKNKSFLFFWYLRFSLLLSLCIGRYFDEISQDTGKYCFGVEDTLKGLEMGAVEILIVYENLDTMRYILRVHGAESNGLENGTQPIYSVSSIAERLF